MIFKPLHHAAGFVFSLNCSKVTHGFFLFFIFHFPVVSTVTGKRRRVPCYIQCELRSHHPQKEQWLPLPSCSSPPPSCSIPSPQVRRFLLEARARISRRRRASGAACRAFGCGRRTEGGGGEVRRWTRCSRWRSRTGAAAPSRGWCS